ncbi:MAG: flagellar biosynthetic protein FliQ [Acidobacteria bacterium]|nr:flagellar biosynthetic protein FliQ [Planctomycetota bacterium]MBE3135226.1 flagellar biosynthetic protein FliQ [Acidobacteriota bacterium]
MDGDFVLYLGRRALETSLLVAAPVLTVATVVGILTAMLQAITSVRDMTLGMVFKLAAVGLTVLLTAGWSLEVVVDFTREVFSHVQMMGH